jgi:Fungal Zn(2)-Cys(6) binuclear cluster domain
MSEPPSSTAPTAPPRKRRRPALSCEQCRSRKIKCDRTYPCAQCVQSKTASCSYSPDTIRSLHHVNYTASLPTQSSLDLPNRPRDVPTGISAYSSSTGLLPNAISNSEATLPTPWTSPSATANDEDTPDHKTLIYRIERIEKELTSSNSGSQAYFSTYESYEPDFRGKGLRGTVSKTRFFGPSHWMHSYGVVRHLSINTESCQLTSIVRQSSIDA